jgi:hypothetical protein
MKICLTSLIVRICKLKAQCDGTIRATTIKNKIKKNRNKCWWGCREITTPVYH